MGNDFSGSMEAGKRGSLFFFFGIFHKQKMGFLDAFFISTLFPGFRWLIIENILNLVLNF
jgi:hypothetical protein